jgi:hypothetical protein
MQDINQYRHLSNADANSTVTVCATPCVLHLVTINTTSAQALTFLDKGINIANNTVAVLKASIVEDTYIYDVYCANGLQVTVPASYAGDATISYDPM